MYFVFQKQKRTRVVLLYKNSTVVHNKFREIDAGYSTKHHPRKNNE
mgnify:CR=1 FL=1